MARPPVWSRSRSGRVLLPGRLGHVGEDGVERVALVAGEPEQLHGPGRLVAVVVGVGWAQDARRVPAAEVGGQVVGEAVVGVFAGEQVGRVVERPVGVLAAAGGDQDRGGGREGLQALDRFGGVGVDPQRGQVGDRVAAAVAACAGGDAEVDVAVAAGAQDRAGGLVGEPDRDEA